jgi:putative DNA primase/helicase
MNTTQGSHSNEKQLVVERADQITMRKLRWLWPQRVPLGKITTFAGLPGEGKSLVTLDVAARVTKGTKYPDIENPLEPAEVLFISGEDDAEDALKPRLVAAGADCSKVHIFKSVLIRSGGRNVERTLRLDDDLAEIKNFLQKNPDIRLAVVDPVTNHLGDASMVDEQEIRALLNPFQTRGVASICVAHLNKKSDQAAIHRVSGAGAFIGLARASWLFARDLTLPSERHMLPLKNNYANGSTLGLRYRILERAVKIEGDDVLTPYVEWIGASAADANEILAPPKRSSRGDAGNFLQDYLSQGPKDTADVYTAAKTRGISERTLDRAKAELGIESRKKGQAGGWEWVLPTVTPQTSGQVGGCQRSGQDVGAVDTLQFCI